MRRIMGLVVVVGLWLGMADESQAQFSMSIGNPYYGQGYSAGVPGYGYPGYSPYGYGSGYNRAYSSGYLAAPTVISAPGFSYSSGYSGYAANPYGTYGRPYYGAYGYGNYGYGSRDGFRPFRGVGRMFR